MKVSEIQKVWINEDSVHIKTKDGKEAFELFKDYPRLYNATQSEREVFELNSFGIRWPDIDEDLSFDGFFNKRHSVVAEIIKQHSVLNVSALARRMNISQPLFAAYISGAKQPSMSRIKKIKEEIRKIGQELSSI